MLKKIAVCVVMMSSSIAVAEPLFVQRTQELRLGGLGQGGGPLANIRARIQARRQAIRDRIQARRAARAAAQQAAQQAAQAQGQAVNSSK